MGNQKKKIKFNLGPPLVVLGILALFGVSFLAAQKADIPVYIYDATSLQNIEETGLDRHYIISRPLTLSGWEPIGSEEKPFTGKLESTYTLTIKSFSNDSAKPMGLFAVNSGIVSGITVHSSIKQEIESDAFGLIAGINTGLIEKCGFFDDKIVATSAPNDCSFGLICGVNKGTIRNCISFASYNISNSTGIVLGGGVGTNDGGNISKCRFSPRDTTINAVDIDFGFAAGDNINGGVISDCLLDGGTYISATGNIKYGTIAGVVSLENQGIIKNCYSNATINITSYGAGSTISTGIGEYFGDVLALENCVSSSIILFKNCDESLCDKGVFYAQSNRESCLKNCYFINRPYYESTIIYGTETTLDNLSVDKLLWDNNVWNVSSDEITFLIEL